MAGDSAEDVALAWLLGKTLEMRGAAGPDSPGCGGPRAKETGTTDARVQMVPLKSYDST